MLLLLFFLLCLCIYKIDNKKKKGIKEKKHATGIAEKYGRNFNGRNRIFFLSSQTYTFCGIYIINIYRWTAHYIYGIYKKKK